ncbi:MAG: tRNA pseudouridine(55) synthase TruB [Acidobacteriota bacterium]
MDSRIESGLILLDKPTGLTSHDCVSEVRKLCPKWMKVGHGGTLDPFSTGLLIILVGKATRLASFFQGMDKVYEGIFKFGVSTDTFDVDGNIVEEGMLPDFQKINLETLANSFVGEQEQIPPSFSAKRVGKKRAYDLARQGKKVVLEPVKINIYGFSLEYVAEDRLKFSLRCSSGTYVRAIARDLGAKINSPCHCLALVRKSIGKFDLTNANSLDDPFNAKGFIPFDKIDLSLAVAKVDYREEKLILNGQDIIASKEIQGTSGWVKFINPKDKFIGLGKVEGRIIHPSVVFPEKV